MSGKKDAKGTFVAVERYADAAAIKVHASNPVSWPALARSLRSRSQHFKKFGAKVGPLCAKQTELTYYDEIGDEAKL
jgi:quinol monooxygenase YgiN